MMEFIDEFLKKIMTEIGPIIDAIKSRGGIPYLVGGSVRDLVLGRETKDIDIEVHKLSLDDLEECLREFGKVALVGKQFGVLRLHGFDIDWSLPRKDSKGRKPKIVIDSDMTIEEASRRRDLTINSMAIDLSAREGEVRIIDPYGGLEDIKKKVLRVVDKDFFVQDPLRFYRVMQFIGRFEMTPDKELDDICKEMDLRDVSVGGEIARERIYEEIKKLLLKSKRPSLGFRWMQNIGRLKELFPELGVLVDIDQRNDYHPEGNVFEHTMQALDASALLDVSPEGKIKSDEEKFMIMLAVLCHDFGKVKCTDENGRCFGHDEAGVPLAKTFLRRFTWDSKLIRSVCKLVRYHMMPLMLVEQESSAKAYKRLAIKLAPEVTAQDLYSLAWADIRGRNKDGFEPLKDGFGDNDKILELFMKNAEGAQVEEGPEEPVLHGRDLLDVIPPGPQMGELLKKAYNIQIDEGITDKDELRKRVLGEKS